jgi:hypothetical protein
MQSAVVDLIPRDGSTGLALPPPPARRIVHVVDRPEERDYQQKELQAHQKQHELRHDKPPRESPHRPAGFEAIVEAITEGRRPIAIDRLSTSRRASLARR